MNLAKRLGVIGGTVALLGVAGYLLEADMAPAAVEKVNYLERVNPGNEEISALTSSQHFKEKLQDYHNERRNDLTKALVCGILGLTGYGMLLTPNSERKEYD